MLEEAADGRDPVPPDALALLGFGDGVRTATSSTEDSGKAGDSASSAAETTVAAAGRFRAATTASPCDHGCVYWVEVSKQNTYPSTCMPWPSEGQHAKVHVPKSNIHRTHVATCMTWPGLLARFGNAFLRKPRIPLFVKSGLLDLASRKVFRNAYDEMRRLPPCIVSALAILVEGFHTDLGDGATSTSLDFVVSRLPRKARDTCN